jgi:hypothetical protein
MNDFATWAAPGAAAGLLTGLLTLRGRIALLVNITVGAIGGLGSVAACARWGPQIGMDMNAMSRLADMAIASVFGGWLLNVAAKWLVRRSIR